MAKAQTPATLRQNADELVCALRRWLGSGKVQSQAGAFCAWRDGRSGTLAFEYPEITGYALTWLAGCEDLNEDELRAGHRAAQWLIGRLRAGDRSARSGWDGGAVYTFDLGMIAAGLLSFGARVENEDYVGQGKLLAQQLASYSTSSEGLRAISPDGPPTQRGAGWSTVGRPHLVKCVQALLLGEQVEAARHLVSQTTVMQAPDGRFPTQPDDERVMLHPHLYAAEGLWMFGRGRDDSHSLSRARDAVAWAWKHQLPSGGMPRWVTHDGAGPEQSDVTAQAIRAAILLGVETPRLEQALSRIISLVKGDGDDTVALTYQPDAPDSHLNAWVTMFGTQALLIAAAGPGALGWRELV